MRVIAPITITDAKLFSTSVPENDYPHWVIGTSYAINAYVIHTATHRVYRSAKSGNISNYPPTDSGLNWIEVGATNRWRVFDQKVSNLTTVVGSMQYQIKPTTEMISAVGLINVGGATITVETFDSSGVKIFSKVINRFGNSSIVDWYTFFTTDLTLEDVDDTIIDGVNGFSGTTVVITVAGVTGSDNVTLGQLVVGTSYELGVTLTGTTIGIIDYSTKERDQYGNAVIVERAFADTVEFQFMLPTDRARRVKSLLSGLRATPALYYVSADLVPYGAQVYGFFQGFDIPLSNDGTCFANLTIEGLT